MWTSSWNWLTSRLRGIIISMNDLGQWNPRWFKLQLLLPVATYTVNPHLHIHVHEDFGAYSELKETKCYAHLKDFWGRWASCLSHYQIKLY